MKKVLFTALMMVAGGMLLAQDPQFSQFYNAPLYLNPGFTGATQQQRVIANHRLQWPNLPQVFSTYALSYEFYMPSLRSGFGLLVTTDKMGTGGWRTTTAGMLYSYKVSLTQGWVFSPGIYFGYGQQGIDRSKLTLGDELATDQPGTNDPNVSRIDNTQYFDVGSGMVLYNKNIWIGFSAFHMNTPNISLLGSEDRLPMKMNLHLGMRVPLYSGPREVSRPSYLTPGIVYRRQGKSFSQLDLGLNYHIDPISIGVWYRGVPLQRSFAYLGGEESKVQQDALVFSIALLFDQFQVGYSYDFTISDLSTTAGGAHEISIIYEFALKPLRRKPKKQNRLLPCPTFLIK